MTRSRNSVELIHEGKYAVEVAVELVYSDESWSPTMSMDDARKLETVRLALKRGGIAGAAKYGRVFELKASRCGMTPTADWIIDLGPEGSDAGGKTVARARWRRSPR